MPLGRQEVWEDSPETDCYSAKSARTVSAAEYVEVFCRGALFKPERLLLAWIASSPSTNEQAKELAFGIQDTFAAWRVEVGQPLT